MIETENGVFMVDPSMVDILDIDQIKPYEKNAKKHDEEQVQQIINSIKAFGMNDPIGVWGKDNICVEGHGRLLALKQMGETKVPVIHLDNLTDEPHDAHVTQATVKCKSCGSSLATKFCGKTYNNLCPVCRAELRPESVMKRRESYKKTLSELQARLKTEDRKQNQKNASKAEMF